MPASDHVGSCGTITQNVGIELSQDQPPLNLVSGIHRGDFYRGFYDTYIDPLNPEQDFASYDNLQWGGQEGRFALIFIQDLIDFTQTEDANNLQATLIVHISQAGSRGIVFENLTPLDQINPTYDLDEALGIIEASAIGDVMVDVTPLVQPFMSIGQFGGADLNLIIVPDDPSDPPMRARSSEFIDDYDQRPRLRITYDQEFELCS